MTIDYSLTLFFSVTIWLKLYAIHYLRWPFAASKLWPANFGAKQEVVAFRALSLHSRRTRTRGGQTRALSQEMHALFDMTGCCLSTARMPTAALYMCFSDPPQ